MSAGASAGAKAAEVGRGRLWQRALLAVGVTTPGMAKAQRCAANWRAGEEGERRTAQLLAPLGQEGWYGLYDRALPGTSRANVDHVLVGPDAQVYALDSKLWAAKDKQRRPLVVHVERGRLTHGASDRDRQVEVARFEAREVSRALGVTVAPWIVVHNTPVADGGFQVRGVSVFPAGRLVESLRANTGRARPGEARRVAELAAVRLPPYVQ